jgi:hypothetical protein
MSFKVNRPVLDLNACGILSQVIISFPIFRWSDFKHKVSFVPVAFDLERINKIDLARQDKRSLDSIISDLRIV